MRLVTSAADLHAALKELRAANRPVPCESGGTVGFVPTMGALHAGHLSLIRKARAESAAVAVSVFVNPTQFGPAEDFDAYPRPIERDSELCQKAGVDVLFAPATAEMYPGGYATYVLQERYTESFEGAIRTGHFHGVCTICAKLFNLIKPDIAYFGQKDYQQCVVVRRMVRDLNFDTRISVCPTVREADGLAVSSRNIYLSPEEREQATALVRALRKATEMFRNGERLAAPLITAMDEVIRQAPLAKEDYIAVVNPETLREIRRVESEAMVLLAVRLGKTRLIDNCHLSARS